jgi:two-component system OmpR family sensor kinase
VRTLDGEADSDVSITSLAVARAVSARTDNAGNIVLDLPELTVLGDADTYVQVVDVRTDQVLAQSTSLVLHDVPRPVPPFPAATQSGGAYLTYNGESGRVRLFSRPIYADGEPVGMVQAARSLRTSDRLLDRLRLLLGLVALLGIPTTAGLGWVLAGRALRPIDLANARLADSNARLERSLAVQRRFLADASHELRTPLTTIRANADVLRWTSSDHSPDQAHALADLSSEAERMGRLVEGLLALARADAGYPRPLEPVALRPLVEETFRQAMLLAGAHRLELTGADDVSVMGDADSLRQLVLILLQNAIKYTPAEGLITLRLRRDGSSAGVQVSDTGIGICSEDLSRVFEPFYRADTARETEGSGLGLAIARTIVQDHGGRIEVTSRPGLGSTFTVHLPALESPRLPVRPLVQST